MKNKQNIPDLFIAIMINDKALSDEMDIFKATDLIKRKKELIAAAERFLKHNTDKGNMVS